MHDVCQNNTGGVGSGYGSVERWCGVSHARMHGHVKADDDNMQVQMLGCMNSMGRVTDTGGGLSGRGKHMEMEEIWMCLAQGVTVPIVDCDIYVNQNVRMKKMRKEIHMQITCN